MKILVALLSILFIIELKFSPRIDTIKNQDYTSIIIWYSIKSKYGLVVREYFTLFNIKH